MQMAADTVFPVDDKAPAFHTVSSTSGKDAAFDTITALNSQGSTADTASSIKDEGPAFNTASLNREEDPAIDTVKPIESSATDIVTPINGEGSAVYAVSCKVNGEDLATKTTTSVNGEYPAFNSVKSVNGDVPATNGNGSAIDTATSLNAEGQSYWWRTSGQDLSRMLQEAHCSEAARDQFLDFYRDVICPLLGNKPESNSKPAAVGWDGNPFEYSFEFKGSTKKPGVRFVLDLSELRPENKEYPLSIANSEKVLETLAKRSPMFDDSWHRALSRWFVYSNASSEKQKALVAQAGYQTQTILGFDINPRILDLAPQKLPVMAKSYFPPCFVAKDRGFGRFQALALGIRQMPDIGSHPNILLALKMIEEYVDDNPHFEDCGRGIATDFVKPGMARLKIYMRYWGTSFEEMWDYYTLGGRIPGLDDDKEKLRDLVDMACGRDCPVDNTKQENPAVKRRRALFATKPSSMYFSLSPEKPYPIPKLYFYPASQAPNDQAIAQGVDAWMRKYGWYDGGKTVEERVQSVFAHRRLEEKPSIFTFIGIGRKEESSTGGLSLQVYVTPELYETPRF